ncbi:hypothetical protein CPB84DRAFT_1851705 [Gymnopilus junonius]|uniref:Uncharacterized protein n=1 Tax=Gymnopilus junonius TaxID=109634 RepID=A0A9P5NFK9_GYMJU|nr:hypothetical protein CPB84DRAFT_1851705 [Gymnopilus junonius]
MTNTNTNTTASSTNSTVSSQQHAGSGAANKVKGVVEYIHGAGENLRGTALSFIDSLGSSGETKYDDIARRGRMEMEQGSRNVRSPNPPHAMATSTSSGYSRSPATDATGMQSYATSGQNGPYDRGSGGYGHPQGYRAGNANMTSGSTYPGHHRDDAVTGVPQSEIQQGQGMEQCKDKA